MSECKVLYVNGHTVSKSGEDFPEVERVLNPYLQAGYKIVSMTGDAFCFFFVLARE